MVSLWLDFARKGRHAAADGPLLCYNRETKTRHTPQQAPPLSAKKLSARKWKNPFYTLLIPAGLAFCVTGFAYGLMAFQEVNAGRTAIEQTTDHPLFRWLQSHGTTAILIELAILAVLTFGAIATDSWWMEEKKVLPADDAETRE